MAIEEEKCERYGMHHDGDRPCYQCMWDELQEYRTKVGNIQLMAHQLRTISEMEKLTLVPHMGFLSEPRVMTRPDGKEKSIDITDLIAEGDLSKIISNLTAFRNGGFTSLYWDGYNASIVIVKKKEDSNG